MELRRDVVPQAQGHVFELGCGGGINQSLYDPGEHFGDFTVRAGIVRPASEGRNFNE